MNAVCPACSIAVVPGYVRCPRCRAELPFGPTRTKRSRGDPGGTALVHNGLPTSAVMAALAVVAAIVVVFGLRSGGEKTEAAPASPPGPIEAADAGPGPRVVAPAVVPAPAPPGAPETARDPAAAADLEDALRRERLWGRAVITGSRIDVRSGSCADPAIRSLVESKQPLLHGAGLTKLRCLEQSGAVVFERDL